jgi:hypothetical protein
VREARIDVSRWHETLMRTIGRPASAPNELNITTLVLVAPGKPTPREMLARFRRSVSQWLANCNAGKAAWAASHRSFNYGHFRDGATWKDPDFIRFLQANGLASAKVVGQDSIDLGEEFERPFEPEKG